MMPAAGSAARDAMSLIVSLASCTLMLAEKPVTYKIKRSYRKKWRQTAREMAELAITYV